MKKITTLLLVALLMFSVFAKGSKEESSDSFVPTKDIDWICTSKPGGGSDIFTQQIKDTMKTKGISDANVVINYVTDGGGEVGRLQVAMTNRNKADHTLLTFNSGDLMPMVTNTDNRVQNFTPIAILAVDKQLLFIGEKSKYSSWQDVLDGLNKGDKIVIAGSKGDDIEVYNKLIEELGISESQLAYIANDSTSGAITSLLGGHVDLCMSKPASAEQYMLAGRMTPVLALSSARFTIDSLKDVPTLSEFGYNDVEVPVWRGVVGPANMSEAAAAYWSACFKAVSETEEWQTNYIKKNGLQSVYMDYNEAKAYMEEYQADYLVQIGKSK